MEEKRDVVAASMGCYFVPTGIRRGTRAFRSDAFGPRRDRRAALCSPVNAETKLKTLSVVMHSDLRVIDPIYTTAYIARDHGYMVYDTLLATDSHQQIRPQMADWKISDDKLTYTFTLRDGLKWHDGQPVTAEDCVLSMKRWSARDAMGQKLMDFTDSLEATDAKTITLKLREPYAHVLESLAKPSAMAPQNRILGRANRTI